MSPCTICYVPSDSELVLPRAEFPGLDFSLPSVKFFPDHLLTFFLFCFCFFVCFFYVVIA